MEHTSLIVGGFTQPAVARSIIETQSGAQRGFCQRFLWIFPEPVFGHLETLTENETENVDNLGMWLPQL